MRECMACGETHPRYDGMSLPLYRPTADGFYITHLRYIGSRRLNHIDNLWLVAGVWMALAAVDVTVLSDVGVQRTISGADGSFCF